MASQVSAHNLLHSKFEAVKVSPLLLRRKAPDSGSRKVFEGISSPRFILAHSTMHALRSHGSMVQRSLLLLKTDLSIIHMRLVLLACRMQEFKSQEGFHPDFKGMSGKPVKKFLKGQRIKMWE